MPSQCPRCASRKILPPAHKIRTLVDTVGRAVRGASSTIACTKPVLGITLGVISDIILASIEGRATAPNLDNQVNHNTSNSRCLVCGYSFSLPV